VIVRGEMLDGGDRVTADCHLVGNQGVRGVQITLEAAAIPYGRSLDVHLRVSLGENGVVGLQKVDTVEVWGEDEDEEPEYVSGGPKGPKA